jgi:predicted transcriptional regulator
MPFVQYAMNRVKRSHLPHLLPEEDMLKLIDEVRREARITRAELGRELDLDRSAITKIFRGKRRLNYDEAEHMIDYIAQRLSPLPAQAIGSIAPPPAKLVRVYSHQKVSTVVRALFHGNFTQVPVYNGRICMGLATDRMIIERLLHPNVSDFKGSWIDTLRNMRIGDAEIIETSARYDPDSPLSSVASALTHFYAVMLGEDMKAPTGIVTRWDFLKLLKERRG